MIDHMYMKAMSKNQSKIILNAIDLFSGLCMAQVVPSERAQATCNALERIFASYGNFRTLYSDQGSSLALNSQVRKLCKTYGVHAIASLPYNSTSNLPIEISNRILRNVIQKTQLTLRENNWTSVFELSKYFYNATERTYMKGTPNQMTVSPYTVVFGRDPKINYDAFSADRISPHQFKNIQQTCQHSLRDYYDKQKSKQFKLDEEAAKRYKIQPDSLVLVRKMPYDKNTPIQYVPNVYKCIDRKHRKLSLLSLFGKPNVIHIHIRHCKPFQNSELLKNLLPRVSDLYGHYYDLKSIPSIMQPYVHKPSHHYTRQKPKPASQPDSDTTRTKPAQLSHQWSHSEDTSTTTPTHKSMKQTPKQPPPAKKKYIPKISFSIIPTSPNQIPPHDVDQPQNQPRTDDSPQHYTPPMNQPNTPGTPQSPNHPRSPQSHASSPRTPPRRKIPLFKLRTPRLITKRQSPEITDPMPTEEELSASPELPTRKPASKPRQDKQRKPHNEKVILENPRHPRRQANAPVWTKDYQM